MPRGDGTGPWWAGGAWGCRRASQGMGGGRRPGFWMGRGQAAYPAQMQQESAAGLKAYADGLASELEAVRKRIKELEKK
jgi:hypothetical protein